MASLRLSCAIAALVAIVGCAAGGPGSPSEPTRLSARLAVAFTPNPVGLATLTGSCDGVQPARRWQQIEITIRETAGVPVTISGYTYRGIYEDGSTGSFVVRDGANFAERFGTARIAGSSSVRGTSTLCTSGSRPLTAMEYTFTGQDENGNEVSVTGRVTLSNDVILIDTVTLTGLTIDGNRNILIRETSQLSAIAIYSNGTRKDITPDATWESSNNSVATVSPLGLVTAVGKGEAVITARYQGREETARITVTLTIDLTGRWTGTMTDPSDGDSWQAAFVLIQDPEKIAGTNTYRVKGTYWYRESVACADLSGTVAEPVGKLPAQLQFTATALEGCSGARGTGNAEISGNTMTGTVIGVRFTFKR